MISPDQWASVFAWSLQHTLRQPKESHGHWKERVFQAAKKRIDDEREALPFLPAPQWNQGQIPLPHVDEPVERVIDINTAIEELWSELLHGKQTRLHKAKARYQRK